MITKVSSPNTPSCHKGNKSKHLHDHKGIKSPSQRYQVQTQLHDHKGNKSKHLHDHKGIKSKHSFMNTRYQGIKSKHIFTITKVSSPNTPSWSQRLVNKGDCCFENQNITLEIFYSFKILALLNVNVITDAAAGEDHARVHSQDGSAVWAADVPIRRGDAGSEADAWRCRYGEWGVHRCDGTVTSVPPSR